MDIIYLIRELLKTRNLQQWVNGRYKDERTIVLDKDGITGIINKYGDVFAVSPDIHTINSVFWRYRFDAIRPTDRVIDLGANIGGFALAVSHHTQLPVLAVEPVRYQYLLQNIQQNKANILAIQAGVGNGEDIEIVWKDGSAIVPIHPLSWFIQKNGGCDFLKIDIEGAEFSIEPEELYGIRRIEGQLHLRSTGGLMWNHPLVQYLKREYKVIFEPNIPKNNPILPHLSYEPMNPIFHAYRKE